MNKNLYITCQRLCTRRQVKSIEDLFRWQTMVLIKDTKLLEGRDFVIVSQAESVVDKLSCAQTNTYIYGEHLYAKLCILTNELKYTI